MRSRWLAASVALLVMTTTAVAARASTPSPPTLTPTAGTYLGAGSYDLQFQNISVDEKSQHVIVLASSTNAAEWWGLSDHYSFLMELNFAGKMLRRWYIGQLLGQVVTGPNGLLFYLGTKRIMVLDPTTLRVVRRIPHPATVGQIALAGGRIWMTTTGNSVWSRPLDGYQKWTQTATSFIFDGIGSSGPYSPFLYDEWQDYTAREPVLVRVNGTTLTPLPNRCGWPDYDDAPWIFPVSRYRGAIGAVESVRGYFIAAGVRICWSSPTALRKTGHLVWNPLGSFSYVTIDSTARWILFAGNGASGQPTGIAITRSDGSTYRILYGATLHGYPTYDRPVTFPTLTPDRQYLMWISTHDGPQASNDAYFHSVRVALPAS